MKFLRPIGLALLLLPGLSLAQTAEPDTGIIDTRKAWEEVAEARDAAAQDRHHEAVADYLEALALDARLVPQVAQEIAYQKLWREDADKAIFYFQRYLARHPGETNRSVRKGLALAYSWSGRQAEAISLYRELVAEDGSDGGARLGLGRSLIWNNELGEGFAVVRGVEDEFPVDSAAGKQSTHFLLTVLDGYTPHLEMRASGITESDGLDTYRLAVGAHLEMLGNMLLQVEPSAAFFRMTDRPDVTAPRFRLGLVGSLAHNWNLHAYGWVDQFRSSDPVWDTATDKLNWTRPGGDLWLTWMAHPRVRFDFGGSSQPLLTYQSFAKELGYEQGSASLDWRFARNLTLGVSGVYGDYSDDNRKLRGGTNLYWKREGPVQILTGPVLTYMDFENPYPGGYWAPDWVRNASWRLMLETRAGRSVFKLDGSLGLEKENGSDALTVGGISGHWGWRLGGNTLAALEVGHSRSRFDSASGYRRTFVNLIWRKIF